MLSKDIRYLLGIPCLLICVICGIAFYSDEKLDPNIILAGGFVASFFPLTLLVSAIRSIIRGQAMLERVQDIEYQGTRTAPTTPETPTIAEELHPRLQSLRPVTVAAIEEALTSPHFTGSHWLTRTRRAQETSAEVCRLAAEIIAAYRARGNFERVRWDKLGPISSRNLDHVWLLFFTTSTAVPFLVLRTGEDAYWFAHFPSGQ